MINCEELLGSSALTTTGKSNTVSTVAQGKGTSVTTSKPHQPHHLLQAQAVPIEQPINSIINRLPSNVIEDIFEYVHQFDLLNLSLTCHKFYELAVNRLYRRVTVILNGEFPIRYKGDSSQYIRENGIRYMNSSIILNIESLLQFFAILHLNPKLIQKVKFFIFDKCYGDSIIDISHIQFKIIEFFGKNSNVMNFLHITFIDFSTGISKLTNFLSHENIRSKVFKLFVTDSRDLYTPVAPECLTNLFLMLNESEFMTLEPEKKLFDLSKKPFDVLNSLFTLTCSTNKQLGLQILENINLMHSDMKLKLKGLTIFHFHKESFNALTPDDEFFYHDEDILFGGLQNNDDVDDNDNDSDHINEFDIEDNDYEFEEDHALVNQPESPRPQQRRRKPINNEDVIEYLQTIDKRLSFKVIHEKVDILYLSHLFLKIDCVEHRLNDCKCFEIFFEDFAKFSSENDGLPNLKSFEVESFPNLDWLRPHQMLEDILTPLGKFIKTLSGLYRLTIDFSTPGFKMFDNTVGLSTHLLNKLNERLIQAFFLCLFSMTNQTLVQNLRKLYLQDFLTSFIYYKPDFYESLLHTCQCWGCQLVLEKLERLFHPIDGHLHEGNEENPPVDLESTYYMLIGYILGKLQADREVCIPIKDYAYHCDRYPIYKGQPHTLHNAFHLSSLCKCVHLTRDPNGLEDTSIDNLVTTYIIHQLKPFVEYLQSIFLDLEHLMIHGIYYEYDKSKMEFIPIFDAGEYPESFLVTKKDEIERGVKPNLPFGYFRNGD
ncbi:uncharacterized protein RJT21DRAFT_111615 [Scheffersomyces amazonensis]|uniref:uncharacterized protein n=1 Tax=Scheffersomyces amazonensis TaxID=1078765 RepID=UPI00315D44EF